MKQFLLLLLTCLSISLSQAQVRIVNDYTRNGTRVIELNYQGVRYSILYNKLSLSEQAPRMVIKNLLSNNSLEFKLPVEGRNVLELRYSDRLFLSASGQLGKLKFDENLDELSESNKSEIGDFASILSEVEPNWPGDDGDGGGIEAHTYKIVGVSAGGTKSLAEHRCNDVYEGMDTGTNCSGTTDCNCVVGQFLCICVCGVFCE